MPRRRDGRRAGSGLVLLFFGHRREKPNLTGAKLWAFRRLQPQSHTLREGVSGDGVNDANDTPAGGVAEPSPAPKLWAYRRQQPQSHTLREGVSGDGVNDANDTPAGGVAEPSPAPKL